MISAFMRELRRRKVIRTCVLYVLVCWIVLQVGDIVFPALGIDDEAASRAFLILAVVGFPITFAFAWFFQITAQGIVRTNAFVERRVLENIPPINDRRRGPRHFLRKEDPTLDYRWILTAQTGPLEGLQFGLSHDITLGRALDCDLAVVAPVISRHHAKLVMDGNQLMVEDLGSSNGTMVNGKLVEGRHYLRNNDELSFRDVIFKVNESYRPPDREMETMDKTTFIRTQEVAEVEALKRAQEESDARRQGGEDA